MINNSVKLGEKWEMRLYIAGETPRSRAALDNLKRVCWNYLRDMCNIEVIDLSKQPEMAAIKQITAIPTLVKELPLPIRRLIGDLSDMEKVLIGLDLTKIK
jgi:circadian clock protein KaiB